MTATRYIPVKWAFQQVRHDYIKYERIILSCKNRWAPIWPLYLATIMIILLIFSPSVKSVTGIDSSHMRTMWGWDSRGNYAQVRLGGIPVSEWSGTNRKQLLSEITQHYIKKINVTNAFICNLFFISHEW